MSIQRELEVGILDAFDVCGLGCGRERKRERVGLGHIPLHVLFEWHC